MRVTYTGVQPAVFLAGGIGLVEPGGEFDVPEDLAEAFTRRPDITPVTAGPGDTAESGDGGTGGARRKRARDNDGGAGAVPAGSNG